MLNLIYSQRSPPLFPVTVLKGHTSHTIYKKIRVGQFGKFFTKHKNPYHFEDYHFDTCFGWEYRGGRRHLITPSNYFSEIIFVAEYIAQHFSFMIHYI